MAAIDHPEMKLSPRPASANSRQKILQNLVGTATKIVNAQLDEFTTRLVDALMRCSDTSGEAKHASLTFNSANLLKKNNYAFHFLASGQMQKHLKHQIDTVDTPLKAVASKIDNELSLVPYEDMDKTLVLNNVARLLEAKHADQLTALRIRLARLLEREEISNNQNPFRPEVLISAINDSWGEFNPDVETHSIVLPLLRTDVFLDLAPLYAALNKELIAAGILPHLADHYNIRKTTDNQEAKKKGERLDPNTLKQLRQIFSPSSEDEEAESNATMPMIPGIPMIPGLPATMMPMTSGIQTHAMQSGMPSRQLLGFLTNLQKYQFTQAASADLAKAVPSASILSSIKAKIPQGTMSRVDESTFDLLGKIFDVVFRDQNIPGEMKGMIGYLQVPVLQAALVDKEFFFKEEHPARRLIELLTRTCVGWDQSKGKNDPLYQAIQKNVSRVQQEFDNQESVFADVVSELEAFIEQEESKAAETLTAPIEQALKQEKWGQATKAAKNEVAMRIGTGEVVAFVETFLENKWVPVLTLAYSIKEEKPDAVESAVKTMDDLVWSVKPKITIEERKELISKLPSMLAMLNKWLNLVNLDDAERLQFFAELAECHASIVRAPLEMSPQRRLEIAMDVAKKAAERRLQKQNEKVPEKPADDFIQNVESLERGMWLEFQQPKGDPKKVKLSWVSPLRTLYIFTSRDKSDSFSLSTEDLAQTMREGRAKVITIAGLVDRAITEAMGGAGANDPNIHEKSVA